MAQDNITILLTQPLPFDAQERFPAGWDIQIGRSGGGPLLSRLPADVLARCDGLLGLLSDNVDRSVIDAAPRLRIVANVGVGYNNVDWQYAKERGIMVTNTPGALTEATADLTMALILAAARRVVEGDRFLRAGHFHGWDLELMLGLELDGAVLGVVGMGRIGQAVARRARAFGMRIVYCSRKALAPKVETELGARRLDLPQLLQEADVVTLHCPLSPETHHLIDSRAFSQMKDGAILVNTARGPVVDEAALAAALRCGQLMAAGLDVYEGEPEVHPDLLALDNVVLLPHIGSATLKTRRAIVYVAVDNLVAFFQAGRALNPIY